MGSHGPPYHGQATQPPGTMRHGPAYSSVYTPSSELLTNTIAAQAAEIEAVLRENKKLAASNAAMRKEVRANLEEVQRNRSHIENIHMESDIQVRGLVDKLRKIDDDVRARDVMKEELAKAREEAKTLIKTKHELTLKHQISDEVIKAAIDCSKLPNLLAELEELKQEHQNLHVTFEHEKGSNKEQVEQLHILERNLISLAREVEKLRAEVVIAKSTASASASAKPYKSNYANPIPLYPGLAANSNVEYARGNSTAYTRSYDYATTQPGAEFSRPQV